MQLRSVDIEVARREDVKNISELWGDLAQLHERLDSAFTPSSGWRQAYEGYLHALLDREDARVLVARGNGRILAYGIGRITLLPPFFAERRRGFIQDVFTRLEHRRNGLGRRLVEALLDWLKGAGMETVELTVGSTNTDAIKFWEHLGFEVYMHHCRRPL